MDDANQSIEQLIALARAGDELAFPKLLNSLEPDLRITVEREFAALNQQSESTDIWATSLERSQQSSFTFEGTSEAEFWDWLQVTVLNQLGKKKQSDAPPSGLLETIAPDEGTSSGNDPLATRAEATPVGLVGQLPLQSFGEYEILATIAKGGMGVVLKARHRKLNRIVALKKILAGQYADTEYIARFHAEAEAVARLRHPNIVGIHEYGECDGEYYISMQFVEGCSLADLIGKDPLQPRAAARYMAAISEAMQHAHDHGILHRDLKPANILLDTADGNDTPLVADFGLAKLDPHNVHEDEQSRVSHSAMTIDGMAMGTPSFMPPEQALGILDEISERSDVYSLGATLYALLTTEPPFAAATVGQTQREVIENAPISPRVRNPNVGKDLETICLKCLEKSPNRRYASAQDLADELQRFLANEPILARPVNFIERTFRWCDRNRWPAAVICVSIVGLIVAIFFWQSAVVARRVADDQRDNAKASQKEAVVARDLARASEAKAVVARDEAKASRNQLFGAINKLFTTWGNTNLLNEPALADVRADLLRSATDLYEDIGQHLGDDPELQRELGISYYRLGQMMFHMKAYHEASSAIQKAFDIQKVNAVINPTDTDLLHDLGDTLTLRGSIQVELSGREQDADKRLLLLGMAATHYLAAIKVRQSLLALDPSNVEFKRQLWNVKMNLGLVSQWKGSAYEKRARDTGDEADFEKMLVEFFAAEEFFKEVQDERMTLLVANPTLTSVRHDSAQGSFNLAYITLQLGDFALAETNIQNAISGFQSLRDGREVDLQNQFELAGCHRLAGLIAAETLQQDVARRHELYDTAVRNFATALLAFENLDNQSPSVVTRYDLALNDLRNLSGKLQAFMATTQDAEVSFQAAVDYLAGLIDLHPGSRRLREFLDEVKASLAAAKEAKTVAPEISAKRA